MSITASYPSASRADVYSEVTDRIVQQLEAGVIPWHRPWTASGLLPCNVRGCKPYRGINIFLLSMAAAAAGYSDPRWGTFKAMKDAGGSVHKGGHGTRIILWKPVVKRAAATDAGEDAGEDSYLLLKTYVVFNVDQCDGIDPLPVPDPREHSPDARAESIVAGYRGAPAILHGGDRAYYSPATDIVRMPDASAFEASDAYYSTLFHELVHSTGHESRLNRLEPALFGSDPYAREELVAELGASMLAGLAGLDCAADDQSAAYVGGWLKKIRGDRKLVIQAAAAAQRASDRIVGATFDNHEEE